MGSMGGDSAGRKKGKKYSNYQRPAEGGKVAKRGKVPKGVYGQSLGSGPNRGSAGKKNGCAVVAIGALGGMIGLTYGAAELVRAIAS